MISVWRSEMGQARPAGSDSVHRTQSSAPPHPNTTPRVGNVQCTQVANRSSTTRNCAEHKRLGGVDAVSAAAMMDTVSQWSQPGQTSEGLLPSVLKSGGWWCGRCAKSFRNGDLLTMHQLLVHRELGPSAAGGGREQAAAGQTTVTTAAPSTSGPNSGPGRVGPSEPCGFTVSEQFDAVSDRSPSSRLGSLLYSNASQAQRPPSSESRIEEFLADTTQSHSLQDAQGASHTHNNALRGSETPFSDPSQSLDSRWQNFSSRAQELFSHPSQIPAAPGADRVTDPYLDYTLIAGPSSATLTPNTAHGPFHAGRVRKSHIGRRCKHCQKIVHLGTDQFQEHEQQCTKQRMGLDCPQCGRSFASKVALKDHVDSLHSRKVFQCRACGMVFKWRTYVYQHRYKCAAYRIKKEPK